MKTCQICDKALYAGNKSGYCRLCWNKSPEKRAKTSAAAKRNWLKPELRAIYSAAGTASISRPEVQERCKAAVKAKRTWEIASQALTPEAYAKCGKRGSDTKMAHIPREYRAEYRRLTRDMRYSAAEASQMIAEQQDKDLAQFRAKLEAARDEAYRRQTESIDA